ncbi:MAG: hypothetical protein HYR77_10265 [Ignavibacteria bacterium]|nr:hypothetical protein [Ignavibacteria bacterium]
MVWIQFQHTFLLLLLLFFSNFSSAYCQVLPFHYYTTKDGLPSNDIHALYQDSRGFIWIGTAEGLSLYDGNAFTNYNTSNGLAFDFVSDVIEDRTSPGTMWIATNGGGVRKFSDGKFTIFHLGSRRISDFVETVMQDRLGVLWCGSDSGVFKIQNNIVTELVLPEFDSECPSTSLRTTRRGERSRTTSPKIRHYHRISS